MFEMMSKQLQIIDGSSIEKVVKIKNGKGTKTVIVRDAKGTRKSTKPIHSAHMEDIQNHRFVNSLFRENTDDLAKQRTRKRRTTKRRTSKQK